MEKLGGYKDHQQVDNCFGNYKNFHNETKYPSKNKNIHWRKVVGLATWETFKEKNLEIEDIDKVVAAVRKSFDDCLEENYLHKR